MIDRIGAVIRVRSSLTYSAASPAAATDLGRDAVRSAGSVTLPGIATIDNGLYHILCVEHPSIEMTTFEERLKESLSDTYEIERELGGGGMSRVFVATERSLGRKVVIKLLSPELTAEVNRGRFRREIQVAAQLQHPHIVTLLAAGEDGELVYYTMPFIPGESLKSALEKHGPLSVRDVVRVLYDVIDALAYAHEHGVVHRDIKPANILRSGSHALVTDFGVAKAIDAARSSTPMTSTGMAIGTPAYMAPEQLAGDPTADHRIDIYAVGLLAYELLSGKSPFAASSPQGVLAAVLTRDPTPLVDIRDDVPQRLSDVIMECLSKVPGGRPPTAEALMVALDMFSTASGEIRTKEHRVPMTPVAAVPVVPIPARAQPGFVVETPPPPFAGAGVPHVLAPLPQTIVPAPGVTSMARDDTISRREPRIAADRSRGRGKILVAGLALLLLAGTGAVLMSQRGGGKTPIGTGELSKDAMVGAASAPVAVVPAAAVPAAVAIPVGPPVTTVADSLAIEAAVQRQLAQAVAAARAAGEATNAAAVKQRLQRQLTDSVARANTPRTAAVAATQALAQPVPQPVAPAAAVASPIAPDATAAAPEPPGKRRLAIADPRQVRDRSELNAFSRTLVDALRASLGNGEAFSLIDQDSVRDVLGRTNTREEAARLIKPDVLVSPAYVGAGDTVNVVVTVWDLRSNSSFGIRVTSTRLVSSNPEPYLAPIVQSVMKQLDDLARAPTIYRKR